MTGSRPDLPNGNWLNHEPTISAVVRRRGSGPAGLMLCLVLAFSERISK